MLWQQCVVASGCSVVDMFEYVVQPMIRIDTIQVTRTEERSVHGNILRAVV